MKVLKRASLTDDDQVTLVDTQRNSLDEEIEGEIEGGDDSYDFEETEEVGR